MEVNLNPQTELLDQTLHTVMKVLEVQQQQALQQHEWMRRNWTTFQMQRMTHEDDVEAYIKSFGHIVIQMGLDRLQWATEMGSLIVGKAQAAYWVLPSKDVYDYEKVKAAPSGANPSIIKSYSKPGRGKRTMSPGISCNF